MNIEARVMKTLKVFSTLATHLLALGVAFTTVAHAQEADRLPNYVPVLPQIKARALAVDPQKGYLVKQVKPDVVVYELNSKDFPDLMIPQVEDPRDSRGCSG